METQPLLIQWHKGPGCFPDFRASFWVSWLLQSLQARLWAYQIRVFDFPVEAFVWADVLAVIVLVGKDWVVRNLIISGVCSALGKQCSDVRWPGLLSKCAIWPSPYFFSLQFISEGSPNGSKELSVCCECLSAISLDLTNSRWTGLKIALFFCCCVCIWVGFGFFFFLLDPARFQHLHHHKKVLTISRIQEWSL